MEIKNQREELKKAIKKRIDLIIKSNDVDTAVDTDGDEGDQSQANLILAMVQEQKNRNNLKIKLLNECIDKIDSNEYGLCEECEENIEIKRLMILPEAKYCIACAERIEKELKGFRR